MIGLALIGCGAWGSVYLPTIANMKEANLIYVCDKSTDILKTVAEKHPQVKTTDDYQTILLDPMVQGVIIATPAVTHYKIALDCIRSSKAVLVEKPITDNISDAKLLVQLSADTDQILMTGHLMEYHPAVERLKDYLSEGAFGKIKYIYCERTNRNVSREDVNVISDLSVHDLSVLFYLLESKPNWISARGIKWQKHLPLATVVIDLGFPQDILAHIHTNWHYPVKTRKISIAGEKMMALFDDTLKTEEKLAVVKGKNKEMLPVPLLTETPLYRQCAHFVACVSDHKQPRSDGEDALRAMEVIEAVEKSILTNSIVYL